MCPKTGHAGLRRDPHPLHARSDVHRAEVAEVLPARLPQPGHLLRGGDQPDPRRPRRRLPAAADDRHRRLHRARRHHHADASNRRPHGRTGIPIEPELDLHTFAPRDIPPSSTSTSAPRTPPACASCASSTAAAAACSAASSRSRSSAIPSSPSSGTTPKRIWARRTVDWWASVPRFRGSAIRRAAERRAARAWLGPDVSRCDQSQPRPTPRWASADTASVPTCRNPGTPEPGTSLALIPRARP